MSAVEKSQLVSEADYLAREALADTKHEYIAGVVYAMAGARNRHNRIVGNCFAYLHTRLRGHKCEPYNSDTKVRVPHLRGPRYYYPDAMVVCDPNAEDDAYQESPEIIVEVLSESTYRLDEGEKMDAYLSLDSVSTYLLVEQDAPLVVAYQRNATGFDRQVYQGIDAIVPMPTIGIELSLAEIYSRIEFE